MRFFIIFCLMLIAAPAYANETEAGPPYSWAAKKCTLDKDKNIAARCYWEISSPDLTHKCLDKWKLLINNTWVRISPMRCFEVPKETLKKARAGKKVKATGKYISDRLKTYKSKVP
jgi:hypothetical protein